MSIILSDSNAPRVFSGQITFYDSGTPSPGANEKKVIYSSSNAPIAYSGQEVIQ